jgi:hypothetical protein
VLPLYTRPPSHMSHWPASTPICACCCCSSVRQQRFVLRAWYETTLGGRCVSAPPSRAYRYCAPHCAVSAAATHPRARAYPHLFIHTLVTNQGDRVRASLNFFCICHSFFDARISCACVAVGPVVHHGRPLAKSHFSQAWSALSEPSPRVTSWLATHQDIRLGIAFNRGKCSLRACVMAKKY